MVKSRYEINFNQLKRELEKIKEENEFTTISYAFAYWFLKNRYPELSEEEISECIIDGPGDQGIDACVYHEEDDEKNNWMHIYQFKFPESEKKLDREIPSDEILKTFAGFNLLVDPSRSTCATDSPAFKDLKAKVSETTFTKYSLFFISFNNGIDNNNTVVEREKETFFNRFGYKLNVEQWNKERVTTLWEKKDRNNPSLKIRYNSGNFTNDATVNGNLIKILEGNVNAYELCEDIQDNIINIFDENIRTAEYNSDVNKKIKETAQSDQSSMFYFYNNGITFVCDSCDQSLGNRTLFLERASIINGCQTVSSLFELYKDNKLKKDVILLIRVIITSSYEERAKITINLNTQNPIKKSYYLSNEKSIYDLQKELMKHNIFLERQANEYHNKKQSIDKEKKFTRVISLEKTIQLYTGYYEDEFAYKAKNNKGDLFEDKLSDKILKNISSEKVINAIETYEQISQVITSYRKVRRQKRLTDTLFSDLLDLTADDILGERYLFMNTADILILNTTKHILNKDKSLDKLSAIKKAIITIEAVINNPKFEKNSVSTLTKKQEIFDEVRNKINS